MEAYWWPIRKETMRCLVWQSFVTVFYANLNASSHRVKLEDDRILWLTLLVFVGICELNWLFKWGQRNSLCLTRRTGNVIPEGMRMIYDFPLSMSVYEFDSWVELVKWLSVYLFLCPLKVGIETIRYLTRKLKGYGILWDIICSTPWQLINTLEQLITTLSVVWLHFGVDVRLTVT